MPKMFLHGKDIDREFENVYNNLGGGTSATSGSGAPTSTPTAIGDKYIDTTAKRSYTAMGTSSSSDWQKQPIFYSGTQTITGGGGDVTVTLPFDWTNGILRIHMSSAANGYFTSSGNYFIYDTSYIALTDGTYTDKQVAAYTYNTGIITTLIKSANVSGLPKSATSTTFVLDDNGTTVYVKYFVWA